MSKQLHKNFTDEQVKLLLKSSKEEYSLNYWPDIKKIRITFLSSITEKQSIEKLIKLSK